MVRFSQSMILLNKHYSTSGIPNNYMITIEELVTRCVYEQFPSKFFAYSSNLIDSFWYDSLQVFWITTPFAHAIKSHLLCPVSNFVIHALFKFGWEWNDFSNSFELWWKKLSMKWAIVTLGLMVHVSSWTMLPCNIDEIKSVWHGTGLTLLYHELFWRDQYEFSLFYHCSPLIKHYGLVVPNKFNSTRVNNVVCNYPLADVLG